MRENSILYDNVILRKVTKLTAYLFHVKYPTHLVPMKPQINIYYALITDLFLSILIFLGYMVYLQII